MSSARENAKCDTGSEGYRIYVFKYATLWSYSFIDYYAVPRLEKTQGLEPKVNDGL